MRIFFDILLAFAVVLLLAHGCALTDRTDLMLAEIRANRLYALDNRARSIDAENAAFAALNEDQRAQWIEDGRLPAVSGDWADVVELGGKP